MKHYPLWVLVSLCAITFGAVRAEASANTSLRTPNPHLRALLIGVSKYDSYNQSGLFPNLDRSHDIDLIQTVLSRSYDLDTHTSDGRLIRLTTPAETTRASILSAFQRLVNSTEPGDIVYIQFSGNGALAPDETRPEGVDNALVPSDYRNDQANFIRYKELNAFLTMLEANHPAQIVLTLDCSHSGQPPSTKPSPGVANDQYIWDSPDPGLAVFCACGAEENAMETKVGKINYGRLTYCLAHALSNDDPGKSNTISNVFQQIQAYFLQNYFSPGGKIGQHPELVCSDEDMVMLSSSSSSAPIYFIVNKNKLGQIILEAGSLDGLTAGSLFKICRKDSDGNPGDEIAEARVVSVNVLTSLLSIDTTSGEKIKLADFVGAVAVAQSYSVSSGLIVDPSDIKLVGKSDASAILTFLKSSALFRVTKNSAGADVHLSLRQGKVALTWGNSLPNARKTPIALVDYGLDFASTLEQKLVRLAQYRYILALKPPSVQSNPVQQVEVRIVRADSSDSTANQSVLNPQKDAIIGQHFTIQVRNDGATPVYVAVFDLESDGNVSLAWPGSSSFAVNSESIIPPASTATDSTNEGWVTLWLEDRSAPEIFSFYSADPAEVFKVIATDEFVDFSGLSTRGLRGESTPFDDLLAPLVGDHTRAAKPLPTTGWSTASLVMNVHPAGTE